MADSGVLTAPATALRGALGDGPYKWGPDIGHRFPAVQAPELTGAAERELADRARRLVTPGIVARGVETAKDAKANWAQVSPITHVEHLFERAHEHQRALTSMAGLAQRFGGVWKDPGIKGQPRVKEKIAEGKAPGRINDVVRGGFLVNYPQQSDEIINELARHHQIADEGWDTNESGYFDRKALLRFPSGMVGEIQFWHPELFSAKQRKGYLFPGVSGHDLYEQYRALSDKDQKSGYGLGLRRRQQALYELARSRLPPEWDEVLRR